MKSKLTGSRDILNVFVRDERHVSEQWENCETSKDWRATVDDSH